MTARADSTYYNIPVWAPAGFNVDKPFEYVPEKVRQPRHYLIFSIVVAVYCLPIGIIAVIVSILSMLARNRGEKERARSIGHFALMLCIVGIVLGTAAWVAFFDTCFISDYQREPKRCVISFRDYFSDDDRKKYS